MKIINKKLLAKHINNIEENKLDQKFCQKLAQIHHKSNTPVIGFIGAPGVGKSSLIAALLKTFNEKNLAIALLLIDPASQFSKSALLGDKIRIDPQIRKQNIFIRSQSSKNAYGGVAMDSFPIITIMRDYADIVIVEAVGSGQDEAHLAHLAEILVHCLNPNQGDFIQMAKSGNMQFPAIHIVTKADSTKLAQVAAIKIKNAKKHDPQYINQEPFIVSAHNNLNIEELADALLNRINLIKPETKQKIRTHALNFWLTESIKLKNGTKALEKINKKYNTDCIAPFIANPFAIDELNL